MILTTLRQFEKVMGNALFYYVIVQMMGSIETESQAISIRWLGTAELAFGFTVTVKTTLKSELNDQFTSQPSKPNLFSLGHFLAKNSSNLVDLTSLANRIRFSSLVMFLIPGFSIHFLMYSPGASTN